MEGNNIVDDDDGDGDDVIIAIEINDIDWPISNRLLNKLKFRLDSNIAHCSISN